MSGAARGHASKGPDGVCPTCGRRGRGTCPGCGRPFVVQRAAAGGGAEAPATGAPAPLAPTAAGAVRGVLGAGGGRALDPATGALLSERLGHDVADVRVHTDGRAAASARALGARAYTVGRDIVFAQGAYRPGTVAGLQLLGHEAAHVVQQRGTVADLRRLSVETSVTGAAEREADRAGDAIAAGRMAPDLSATPAGVLARKIVNEDAGGCGVCENAMLAGVQAHMLIQYYLTRQIPGLQREYPLPAQAPGDTTPPAGGGRLDLCVLTRDEVLMAEIKPSNATQIAQGKKDLLFYFNLIDHNTDDPELAHRHARLLDLKEVSGPTFIWMFRDWWLTPDPGAPPCLQQLYLEKVQPGLYTYWCEPPGSQLKGKPGCDKCRPKKDKDQPEDTDHPDFPIADELKEAKPKDAPKETPKQPPRPEAEKPKEAPQEEPKPEKPAPEPEGEKPPAPEPEGEKPPAPEPEGEKPPAPEPEGGKGNGKPEPGRPNGRPGGGDRGSGGKGQRRPGRPGPPGPFPYPVPGRPEIPIGIALMAMLVVLAKQLPKKVVAPVVYAEAAAMVVLLAAGRVEARPNLEGTDPLEGLYRVMTEKGRPPSPELKKLLESDPKLAEALRNAARTGDVTPAQEELSKRTMQVIEDNLDQFSDEQLELLLKQQQSAPLPGVDVTVESLKRALANRRAAAGKGSGSGGKGPAAKPPAGAEQAPTPGPKAAEPGPQGATPPSREAQARLAAAGAPVERLWQGVTGGGPKGGIAASPELLDDFLRRVTTSPPLTDAEVDALLAAARPAAEGTDRAALMAALDEAMRALLEARKQPAKKPGPGGDADRGAADAGTKDTPPSGPADKGGAPDKDATKPSRPVSQMLAGYSSLTKGAWRFDPLGPFKFEDKPKDTPVFVAERLGDGTLRGGFTTVTVTGAGAGKGHWAIVRGAISWSDEHDAEAGSSPSGTFDVVPVAQ